MAKLNVKFYEEDYSERAYLDERDMKDLGIYDAHKEYSDYREYDEFYNCRVIDLNELEEYSAMRHNEEELKFMKGYKG